MTDRRRAYRAGRRAETLAAWLLRLKGYRILARGYRTSVGEIDIVARRRGIIAIVEVKRRDRLETGLYALSTRQRRRIARAAEAFRLTRPAWQRLMIRFDIIVVVPRRPPRHIMDAWRL